MGISRTGMKEKLNKFFHNSLEQKTPSETETLNMEMHLLIDKLNRSWNNFLYASDKFVDIAVMEIHHNEMEHSILYHKILELNNKRGKDRNCAISTRSYLPWLQTNSAGNTANAASNTPNFKEEISNSNGEVSNSNREVNSSSGEINNLDQETDRPGREADIFDKVI